MKRLSARALVAIVAYLAVVTGLWIERPSAALVVGGGLLLADLVLTKKRVRHDT